MSNVKAMAAAQNGRGFHRVTKSVVIAIQVAVRGFRQSYTNGHSCDAIMGYEDSLTGIPNRKAFERDRAAFDEGYALIMIDVDNFKSINDSKGHSFGDIILQRLAAILKNAAGPDGHAYRIGGDEFVAVVPLHTSAAFCRTIRHSMRKEDAFSISQGIARLDSKDKTAEALMLADTALYRVKANGKNGLAIAEGFASPELMAVGA